MKLAVVALVTLILEITMPAIVSAKDIELARVSAIELNVRNSPNVSGKVLGTLKMGAIVGVLARQGGWAHILSIENGKRLTGWANETYLSAIPAVRNPPATPRVPMQGAYLPNPLSFKPNSFDCHESPAGGGFDSCELAISIDVSLPSDYSPYLKDSVTIECAAEVEYHRANGYFTETDSERGTAYVSLYNGSGSESITLDFSLGFGVDPVTNARVSSLDCSPE
ncbi:SH3 domain-containing protein [Acidimangrovimonas pyrenivorans]|uniref:SH3 domain-containing protein n=1 Tax=Acidimangrovimonas pyrenivorans TaxID=2030798 RepID=A0ABV7ACE1_9RHOB